MNPEHKTPLTDALAKREDPTPAPADARDLLAGYRDLAKVLEFLSILAPGWPVQKVTPDRGGYAIDIDWRDHSGFTPAVGLASRVSLASGVDVEAATDYVLFVPISKES